MQLVIHEQCSVKSASLSHSSSQIRRCGKSSPCIQVADRLSLLDEDRILELSSARRCGFAKISRLVSQLAHSRRLSRRLSTGCSAEGSKSEQAVPRFVHLHLRTLRLGMRGCATKTDSSEGEESLKLSPSGCFPASECIILYQCRGRVRTGPDETSRSVCKGRSEFVAITIAFQFNSQTVQQSHIFFAARDSEV
jgi:hypothetical protein